MNDKSLKATAIFLLISLLSACTENEKYARAITSSISCKVDCSSVVDSLLASESLSKLFEKEVPASDTVIQFGDYVGYQENTTILLKDNYEAEPGTYLIRIGSDDGFRLFLNDERIGENLSKRGLHPDMDWVVTDLQFGRNELIFQVDQTEGSWGLHYKIEPYDKEKLKKLILEYIPEIYADLPESCILPDFASHLALNLDTRIKHDQFHILRYRWINIIDNSTSDWIEYMANAFPEKIDLPGNFDGFKIFDYELINQDRDFLYKESIPIFSRAMVLQKVADFKYALQEDESKKAYLENLSLHYPSLFGKEKELDFSTRHKAEFLLDLLVLENEELLLSGGPRIESFNGKLFRTYTPYNVTASKDLIVGFHVELEDTVNQYFKSYAGKSHAKMVEWNSYMQASGNTLIMPFIKPGSENLNISAFHKDYFQKIDTEGFQLIKVVSWSKGVPILLKEFTKDQLLYNEAHMISSWLMISEQEAFETANLIRNFNPTTEFIFWHGNEDTEVPYSYIEDWSVSFERNGLNSKILIQPNSSHWSYFSPVGKKIINKTSSL